MSLYIRDGYHNRYDGVDQNLQRLSRTRARGVAHYRIHADVQFVSADNGQVERCHGLEDYAARLQCLLSRVLHGLRGSKNNESTVGTSGTPYRRLEAHVFSIVFRALQGIGGSGLYSLVFVAIMKLITPEKIGFYSGVISSVFALANLLGPVLGGVIADRTR